MANKNASVQRHEIEGILTRLDWIDEERRKANKKVVELEQQIASKDRAITLSEQRIQELETRLTTANSSLNRLTGFDSTLQAFKDELVELIEQYEARRIQAMDEAERLRRLEQEMALREIADVRKQVTEIGRLRTDMELRQAEEARLSNLIGKLQGRLPSIDNRMENWEREIEVVQATERSRTKQVTEIEAKMLEINRRFDAVNSRLDSIASSVLKFDNQVQDLLTAQQDVRQTIKKWAEQVQLGEYERNQRLDVWQQHIEAQKETLENFTQEWVGITDQYKQAQMAVQTLTEWQRQAEQQQKEMAEINRVEVNRMQTRWDNFLAENEKRWRNLLVDVEQVTKTGDRRDKQLEVQVFELSDLIKKMQSEAESLWRVQSAQLDAIKQLPRVWLEEVEKARSRDPQRRRQTPLVPVDDDLF